MTWRGPSSLLSRGQAGTSQVRRLSCRFRCERLTSEQLEVTLKAADRAAQRCHLGPAGRRGPAQGRGIHATLELKGTVGTPALHGQLTVSHGNDGDLTGIGGGSAGDGLWIASPRQ